MLFRGRFQLRVLYVLVLLICCFTAFAGYIYLWSRPSYQLYRELEENELTQSLLTASVPSGNGMKYVMFRQLQGAGFSNQAQEILLYHHLAQLSHRTYVYQPLVIRHRGETAPLSAFFSGVTNKDAISAVSFENVCLPQETKHVSLGENTSQMQLWEHSLASLSSDDRCVVVDDWILNWNYLASPGIHSIWASYQQYLHTNFLWSNPILRLVDRSHSELNLKSPSHNGHPYLAIHFRRGDFRDHCDILAQRQVGFTTWATLPILRDSIYSPSLNTSNPLSVQEHCYPNIERIASAVDAQLSSRPHIKTVFISHDAAWDHPHVYYQKRMLETALKRLRHGQIDRVLHSGMLPRKLGEADFAVPLDTEIARRAEVFIGIGYSSLSTQVIALRLGADMGDVRDITLI